VRRGKAHKTTTPEAAATRPADLVERDFSATRPNQLWLADLTYVATWSGFVYVALVVDAFSRFLVGWQASRSLRTDLALEGPGDGHLGPPWRAGGVGASLGQGQPVSRHPLHRTPRRGRRGHLGGLPWRLLRQRPGRDHHRAVQDRADPPAWPWKGLDEVEYATLEWVDWFNHRRLSAPIGYVPPAEFEADYHRREDPSRTAGLKDPSLR
jgi:transposase InsO family protein